MSDYGWEYGDAITVTIDWSTATDDWKSDDNPLSLRSWKIEELLKMPSIIARGFAACLVPKHDREFLIRVVESKSAFHFKEKNYFAAIREFERAIERLSINDNNNNDSNNNNDNNNDDSKVLIVQLQIMKTRLLVRLQRYAAAIETLEEMLPSISNAPPSVFSPEIQTEVRELEVKAREGYRKLQEIIDYNHDQCMYALIYDVLQHVFSYLQARDLVSASKVCIPWREASFRRLRQLSTLATTKQKDSIGFMTLNAMLEAILIDAIRCCDIDKFQSVLYNFPHHLRTLQIQQSPFSLFLLNELLEVSDSDSDSSEAMLGLFRKALEMGMDVLLPNSLLSILMARYQDNGMIDPKLVIKLAVMMIEFGADFDKTSAFTVMMRKEIHKLLGYIEIDKSLYESLLSKPNEVALKILIDIRYCTPAELLLDLVKLRYATANGLTGISIASLSWPQKLETSVQWLLETYLATPGALTRALELRDAHRFHAYDWVRLRERLSNVKKGVMSELMRGMNQEIPPTIAWVCFRCMLLRDGVTGNTCVSHRRSRYLDQYWYSYGPSWGCCDKDACETWVEGCVTVTGHQWIPEVDSNGNSNDNDSESGRKKRVSRARRRKENKGGKKM